MAIRIRHRIDVYPPRRFKHARKRHAACTTLSLGRVPNHAAEIPTLHCCIHPLDAVGHRHLASPRYSGHRHRWLVQSAAKLIFCSRLKKTARDCGPFSLHRHGESAPYLAGFTNRKVIRSDSPIALYFSRSLSFNVNTGGKVHTPSL